MNSSSPTTKANFSKITSLAPTRVDLIGGTLDLWPIHCLFPQGATINFGVEAFAKVEIEPSEIFCLKSKDLDLEVSGSFQQVVESEKLRLLSMILEAYWPKDGPAIKLTTEAMSPPGAGLGGSSCLSVAIAKGLLAAREKCGWNDMEQTDQELIRTVQNIEAKLIHTPTGCQDYWGGLAAVSYTHLTLPTIYSV